MSSGRPVTLAAITAEFQSISQRAADVVSRAGERVTERPSPAGWSVAECLIHLSLASEAYFPIWREALNRARTEGLTGSEPFDLDLWGRFWVWFLEPPPKIRFPAPRRFMPSTLPSGDQPLPNFLSVQEQVISVIDMSQGLPIDRIIISSAFDRRVRYSIWSSFCANASHQRRHLWQAEQVAKQIGTCHHS